MKRDFEPMPLSRLQTEFTNRKALMLQDRNALRGLINDCLYDERAKANQLRAAIECGALDKIQREDNPKAPLFQHNIAKLIQNDYGYEPHICAWIVDVWVALIHGDELPEEAGPISQAQAPQQRKSVPRPPAPASSKVQLISSINRP